MINLQLLQTAAAACEPAAVDQLGWRLWCRGLPCRPITLPPQWWQQPTEIESGLWISADQQDPPRWWLVQQRGSRVQVRPLHSPAGAIPALETLQRNALSLWPLLRTDGPLRWRALLGYLQLGVASRRALPAALLRAGLWLVMPALLWAALQDRRAAVPALLLALASLGLGALLDNQWHRLWLNRSERQRSALGLNGMQRVLRLPLPLLQRMGGGGAMGLGTALQQLGQELPLAMGRLLPAAALLASSSLVLLVWQPRLGLISLGASAIWLGASAWLWRRGEDPRRRQGQHRALALLRSQALIELCSSLRLAGAEQRALQWWQECESAAQRLQPQLDRHGLLLAAIALMVALISGVEALRLNDRHAVMVGLSLVGLQLGSGLQLSAQLRQLEALQPSWTAASLLMASPSDWRPDADDPGPLRGELAADDLSFRYGPEQPLVLDGVSFQAKAGSFVAVVGPSGSGKSTLLRLLLGFEQPLGGRILLDGRDASELQHELLRPQIGTVLQNARLVGGTLLEVIAAGRPISVEQAWIAAEQAGLGDELRALPMGLQTLVPAGGSTLSGGQRQRLAIARALAGAPRLLLFDEPTSALDNRSQQTVLNSLEQLAITRVLVAHRLSTVRHADWILVLAGGRLVQQGRYDDLLAQPGVFAALMQRQTL